jgi:hypothetical protein
MYREVPTTGHFKSFEALGESIFVSDKQPAAKWRYKAAIVK